MFDLNYTFIYSLLEKKIQLQNQLKNLMFQSNN